HYPTTSITDVAFSPDGQTALAYGKDPPMVLSFDTTTGRSRGVPIEPGGAVMDVTFTPDSRSVLIGLNNGTARLWDLATGKPLGRPMIHPTTITAVACGGPDGWLLATGSEDGLARLWDAPPPEMGSPEHVRRAIEKLTGLRLDEQGVVHGVIG